MIGIDLTDWTRFAEMNLQQRTAIAQRYNHEYIEPKDLAKWWACHEAIYKSIGRSPDWSASKILFPDNSSPQYTGPEKISLSISHERNLIVAVAVCLEL